MSSLLQFGGMTGRRGARLEFYRTTPSARWPDGAAILGDVAEDVPCHLCERGPHPQLYVAWRVPAGMLGCWVLWRINGKAEALDLSTPTATYRIPRDAKPLPAAENCEAWHRD